MTNKSSAQKFAVDLQEFAEALDVSIGIVVTKLALEAWTRITERTPVDTGRARASWAVKEGESSDYVPDEEDHSDPDLPSVAFKGHKSVFVTSALDYMAYLEDGSSKQAPAGMVAITIAELEVEAEAIIESQQ